MLSFVSAHGNRSIRKLLIYRFRIDRKRSIKFYDIVDENLLMVVARLFASVLTTPVEIHMLVRH